jgi:hypothetical protein
VLCKVRDQFMASVEPHIPDKRLPSIQHNRLARGLPTWGNF